MNFRVSICLKMRRRHAEGENILYLYYGRSFFRCFPASLILIIFIASREIALQRLAVFVKKFVWTVSRTRGISDAVANVARICVFGSCGLGIHSPGDDLDILCVVPKHFSRDDFLTVFKRMLRKVKGVSGIVVSDADMYDNKQINVS